MTGLWGCGVELGNCWRCSKEEERTKKKEGRKKEKKSDECWALYVNGSSHF
jgi:hypothetical protein